MDETRQRLLEAAGEVFSQKGFEAATVREISAAANANIAAVNYYFGDKQRLYIEAVKFAHCMQQDIAAFSWPEGMCPAEKLRQFMHQMMGEMLAEKPQWMLDLVMKEMARPTNACVETVQSFIGPRFTILVGIIRELAPNVPDRKIQLLAFSVVGQALLYRTHRVVGELLVGKNEFTSLHAAEIAEHITQFSLAGIREMQTSGVPVWEPAP